MNDFKTRSEARRISVENPHSVNAFAGGYWPPYSRAEMMKIPAVLRRIVALGSSARTMPDYVLSPRVMLWRLQELAKVISERTRRHASRTTWSLTLSNGKTVRFPLDDPSAVAFKDMAAEFEPYYEKALADFLIETLKPGDIFVDGGANVGYVSGVAATTGAVVFAIEIQRELISQIEAMATLNEFDLIRPLHLGLSSGAGLTSMWRTGINFGAGLEGETSRARHDEPCSIADDFVPVMPLDDLFAAPGMTPAVVKIDVEGHEISVLQGARQLIEKRRTIFVVEYHAHMLQLYGHGPNDLMTMFANGGWEIHQLTDDGLVPLATLDDLKPDPRDPNPKIIFTPKP
ncbi:FkbM family methyltransferase [Thalassobaculum sp. OXR-137]|uniref:FkbM family methyltransferase n=1 Tax=Thalassobaculum sp. OXR-137 TaxID=3100173 RepID=UPI002AC8B074|nr:FkbM family methyltransferase [Thalassobaculum sp. OXR-137]WPZ32268.1 FkbM family methyltransferase [Thalassobaculum sp. OXR-137]